MNSLTPQTDARSLVTTEQIRSNIGREWTEIVDSDLARKLELELGICKAKAKEYEATRGAMLERLMENER